MLFRGILTTIFVVLSVAHGAAADEHDDPGKEVVDDDTATVDTETTADPVLERQKLHVSGDLRLIADYFDIKLAEGGGIGDHEFGGRLRLRSEFGLSRHLQVGTRLAGRGFASGFDPEFVWQPDAPGSNGLESGQFTFDELFLRWSPTKQLSVTTGRIQTRFVLRSGVFARSLDRNDSNNINVTWTDGLQAVLRTRKGWETHFIMQYNSADGSGSIRRGQLDFGDRDSRVTYFGAVQNFQPWGPVVQRTLDVSYLPKSLLVDGNTSGRREDYWAIVGRLAMRWPQRATGPRIRGGIELGYAPNTPSSTALNLDEAVDGVAWNIVVSLMDFVPKNSIAVNYGRIDAGWMLSPHFRPNEETVELRYQWRPDNFPLIEARVRWRQDLDRELDSLQRSRVVDGFIRLTAQFDVFQR